MGDTVNRIVPASISLDRTSALGREREREKKRNERKNSADPQPEAAAPPGPTLDDELKDLEQDKGKNLNIKA